MIVTTQTIRAAFLAAGLVAVSAPVFAGDMPSSISIYLPATAHKTSIQDVQRGLTELGFKEVGDVTQDGRIFEARANWDGRPLTLRINAESGLIRDASASAAVTTTRSEIPSPIVVPSDPQDATVHEVQSALVTLGFEDVTNIERDGRIFTAEASWKGKSLNLRIDTRNGRATDRSTLAAVDSTRIPSSLVLSADGHETTMQDVKRALVH